MLCSRAGFAWSFVSRVTQRRKGERTLLLLRLHYTIFSSPRLLRDGCLLLRLSLKRSEEGEREELITNRGLATVVFMLGLCQEVQTQRRGRENERFLPLSPRPKSGGTLSFYWVCEESPNPGEEEEEST